MEPRLFDNTIIRRGHYSVCAERIMYSTTSDVAHKLFCYKSSKICQQASNRYMLLYFATSHSVSLYLAPSRSVTLRVTLSHSVSYLFHSVSLCLISVSLCITLYLSVSLRLTLSHWRGTYFAKSLLASRFSTKHVEKHLYLYVCVKSELKRACGVTYS